VIAERYLILEQFGRGGMSVLYRAQDLRLEDKEVALKEMTEELIPDSERIKVLESFKREAELLARLSHPNLVRVTDYFQEGSRHYMVMEFIHGKTLDALVEARFDPFTEEEVLYWANQLCDVLAFLHAQDPPIIYRDIKPPNIMIADEDNGVRLIDFGIARFYKPGKAKDTIQFGTDGYAAPEQYGQAQTDARADVYALGATLHQLLTLHDPTTKPFSFPPIRKLNPAVTPEVAKAIEKALDLNCEQRHSSTSEMWTALSGERPTWTYQPQSFPLEDSVKGEDQEGEGEGQVATNTLEPITLREGAARITWSLKVPPGATGKLSSDAPWLTTQPTQVPSSGTVVTVEARTRPLSTGRLRMEGGLLKRWLGWHTSRIIPTKQEYCSHVLLERADGQQQRYPVCVTVLPKGWRVGFGWLATLVLILVELAIPVALAVAALFFV
jgi:serine/threonine protein kinase